MNLKKRISLFSILLFLFTVGFLGCGKTDPVKKTVPEREEAEETSSGQMLPSEYADSEMIQDNEEIPTETELWMQMRRNHFRKRQKTQTVFPRRKLLQRIL